MRPNFTKRIILAILVIVFVGIVILIVNAIRNQSDERVPAEVSNNISPVHRIIGSSVKGRSIDAYTFGNGTTSLLIVGGIHGGYEWNSVSLAYAFMDYISENADVLPNDISITIIPSANPDGVFSVTGKDGRFSMADVSTSTTVLESARFNANKVDLNRNFDCKWKPKSTWREKTVSAGKTVFSEPETLALKNFVESNKLIGAVFLHSQADGVYASQCEDGILPETLQMMSAYSKASGYPAVKEFDAYVTTGAADDWMASINIPAITVELKTHSAIEWEQNVAGLKALIQYLSN